MPNKKTRQQPDQVYRFSDDPSENPNLRLPWMTQNFSERGQARNLERGAAVMGEEGTYAAPLPGETESDIVTKISGALKPKRGHCGFFHSST